MSRADFEQRLAEYRALSAHLVDARRFDGGFAWVLRGDAALEARVRDLAAREMECCPFFRIEVRPDGERIVWEARAEESAAPMLEELFGYCARDVVAR